MDIPQISLTIKSMMEQIAISGVDTDDMSALFKEARKLSNFSSYDLAMITGLSVADISKIEEGKACVAEAFPFSLFLICMGKLLIKIQGE